MSDRFKITIAKGIFNRFAVLSVPVAYHQRLSRIMDEVEFDEAMEPGQILPEEPGVYCLEVAICGKDGEDWLIVYKTEASMKFTNTD